METARKDILLNAAVVLSAVGASLCCILPVAVAILGAGSAALGARLEPFRPFFIVLTVALLGFAFYQAYKPRKCGPGDVCAVPANRRRYRIFLWMVAGAATLVIAFPHYAGWLS